MQLQRTRIAAVAFEVVVHIILATGNDVRVVAQINSVKVEDEASISRTEDADGKSAHFGVEDLEVTPRLRHLLSHGFVVQSQFADQLGTSYRPQQRRGFASLSWPPASWPTRLATPGNAPKLSTFCVSWIATHRTPLQLRPFRKAARHEPAQTPEADAQRAIVQVLRFDAIVHHCANEVTDARRRGPRRQSILVGMGVHAGYADLIVISGGGVLFPEVKSATGAEGCAMSQKATVWALDQRSTTGSTKIVLWHLCDRYNPEHGCIPSQELLAYACQVSEENDDGLQRCD